MYLHLYIFIHLFIPNYIYLRSDAVHAMYLHLLELPLRVSARFTCTEYVSMAVVTDMLSQNVHHPPHLLSLPTLLP